MRLTSLKTATALSLALLTASATLPPPVKAGWFWPFVLGTGARTAAATATRGALVTGARTVVAGGGARAAATGLAAGLAGGAVVHSVTANAEEGYTENGSDICLFGDEAYFKPEWAESCL